MENKCLNFLKGISCIGVILMHCGFPGTFGKYISYLFKFAVPIFFMISGYFSYNESREVVKNKLPKKMKHILKLTIIAEVFYGIVALFKKNLLNNDINIKYNFYEILSNIFVGTFFNGTLWFLYALFWSYVCLYIINKFDLYKKSYKLASCILIVHVIFRTYAKTLSWYDVRFFRNFLIHGLPFVIIGNCIHKNKEIIYKKISDNKCMFGIILGVFCTIVEYLLSRQALDFYIGTIIMSCSMFIYAIKNSEKKINSILYTIGDKISMYVYILHILAIDISQEIGNRLNIGFYEWIKPINSIIISIILASICRIIFNLKSKDEIVSYGKN